jgi:8-oxo-dGTP pyrophosphatase MutT (NUDIX family)
MNEEAWSNTRPLSGWGLADVEHRLSGALGHLPGIPAQARMAPQPRVGWRPAETPADSRVAAALIVLYPGPSTTHLALTVRSARLPQHPGQVSLPGGAVEPDESIEAAALREAHEEVALDPSIVRVIGRLSPLHIPVSGFVLYPVVGAVDRFPGLHPEATEVARVLDVPLSVLADPGTVRTRLRVHEGREYEVPYFAVDGEQVWGATAMVLAEFLTVLGLDRGLPRLKPEEGLRLKA